jgi:DivIVA domain-containing protein
VSLILYGLAAVLIAGIVFFLFARFVPPGEQIAPALRDNPLWLAPVGQRVTAEDVEQLRLPVALRGYRFAETDRLLDRLANELRDRDAEIARLKGESETVPHSS